MLSSRGQSGGVACLLADCFVRKASKVSLDQWEVGLVLNVGSEYLMSRETMGRTDIGFGFIGRTPQAAGAK